MTHLSDAQMAEAIEGRNDRIAVSHLDTCAACREQVEALRTLLRVLHDDRAPLPIESPDAFSERVNARITALDRADDGVNPFGYGRRLALAAMFILAVGLAVGFSYVASHPEMPPEDAVAAERRNPPEPGGPGDGDEAWIAIQSLAEDLEYDDVLGEGVVAAPGTLERAALELTDEERAELIRLIEIEMKRTRS